MFSYNMVLYTLFCLKCFKWLYFGVILDYLVRDIHVYKFFVGFCDFLKVKVFYITLYVPVISNVKILLKLYFTLIYLKCCSMFVPTN